MHAIHYRSTWCWFVPGRDGRLLAIDAGWPGSLYEYAREMKAAGIHLEDVAWAVVTHFHMDHAGLVGAFQERGIRCFAFENQLDGIDLMETMIARTYRGYVRISRDALRVVPIAGARALFAERGVGGTAFVTGYHSTDSVTYVLDTKEAIVGDLPPEGQMMPDDLPFQDAWTRVRASGADTAWCSHAGRCSLA